MKHARNDYDVIQDASLGIALANMILNDETIYSREITIAAMKVLGRYLDANGPQPIIPNDEPVFLLRAQDRFAAATVRHWASLVQYEGEKISDCIEIANIARQHAKKMDKWRTKKTPDLPNIRMKTVTNDDIRTDVTVEQQIVHELNSFIKHLNSKYGGPLLKAAEGKAEEIVSDFNYIAE